MQSFYTFRLSENIYLYINYGRSTRRYSICYTNLRRIDRLSDFGFLSLLLSVLQTRYTVAKYNFSITNDFMA